MEPGSDVGSIGPFLRDITMFSENVRLRIALGGCVCIACAALLQPVILTAGSASAELHVSVTVSRSCAVDTGAVDESLTTLRVACASGATSGILVGNTIASPAHGERAMTFQVQQASDGASNDVRVVTFDF